jgi:Zn-finger nucleic acid-binding protein
MSEPALRCPGCGAPATADAARCDYCGSALATMTCGACFAPMFVGSRFCAHCGAEVTRILVDDDVTRHCPRCEEPLQGLTLGTTSARECAACGGLWLDPDALQRLVDAKEESAAIVSVLAARIPTAVVPPDVVRYVPCPNCGKLMNRTNFARSSGVILDSCRSHGVWLDRGELQGVLRFVGSGGLAVAREREKAQLGEEQRRLAAMASYADRPGGSGAFTLPSHPAPSTDMAPTSALERLLLDALGVIHGR